MLSSSDSMIVPAGSALAQADQCVLRGPAACLALLAAWCLQALREGQIARASDLMTEACGYLDRIEKGPLAERACALLEAISRVGMQLEAEALAAAMFGMEQVRS